MGKCLPQMDNIKLNFFLTRPILFHIKPHIRCSILEKNAIRFFTAGCSVSYKAIDNYWFLGPQTSLEQKCNLTLKWVHLPVSDSLFWRASILWHTEKQTTPLWSRQTDRQRAMHMSTLCINTGGLNKMKTDRGINCPWSTAHKRRSSLTQKLLLYNSFFLVKWIQSYHYRCV